MGWWDEAEAKRRSKESVAESERAPSRVTERRAEPVNDGAPRCSLCGRKTWHMEFIGQSRIPVCNANRGESDEGCYWKLPYETRHS